MIIRELCEVISQGKQVFIKPPGRRLYFQGTALEIPDGLLECIVREINPQCFYEDDVHSIKRYRVELGIWVDSIPEWDKKADEDIKKDREIINSIIAESAIEEELDLITTGL